MSSFTPSPIRPPAAGPPESDVARPLVRAYVGARYRVDDGRVGFELRVGEPSAALAWLQRRHAVSCSALLGACNPFGQELGEAANAALDARLRRHLGRLGLRWLAALGTDEDPLSDWPGERAALALGMTRESAVAIGARFAQNAVLHAGPDAVPHLVLLR